MAQHSGFGGSWGSIAWGGIDVRTKQTKQIEINGQVRVEITPDPSINGQTRIRETVRKTIQGRVRIKKTAATGINGQTRIEKIASKTDKIDCVFCGRGITFVETFS